MKQKFIVTIDHPEELHIGQIAVPLMDALKLEKIKVDNAAQQSVQRTAGTDARPEPNQHPETIGDTTRRR